MLPYRDSRITRIAIVIFFCIAIGYAFFEVQGVLYGPKIQVTPGITEVHEPFITIAGRADRISSLTMNGKAVNVTGEGVFNEPYLLAAGLNRIVLDAADKYGRSRQQVIQIVYTPAAASTTPEQTTISANSTTTTSASTSPMAQ